MTLHSKKKKCKVCKIEFEPFRSTQNVCSYVCAAALAKIKREKKEEREWKLRKKIMKDNLETVSILVKKAQTVFNRYIRLRDQGKSCISCQREYKDNFQAGHFLSAGGHWSVRFNENNCFGQCIRCNMYLSGNLQKYSKNILTRITQEELDDLLIESQKTRKYTKEELREIISVYNEKIKNFKKK